jgi:hypothetical protein
MSVGASNTALAFLDRLRLPSTTKLNLPNLRSASVIVPNESTARHEDATFSYMAAIHPPSRVIGS